MKNRFRKLLAGAVLVSGMAWGMTAQAGAVRAGFDGFTVPASSSDPDGGMGDNGSVGPVSIGFPVNFYCNTYSNVYVNVNGSITFDSFNGAGTWYEMYQLELPIIAPFYADADVRPVGTVKYGSGTVDGQQAFGVTWDEVGYNLNHGDRTNRFQAILISRADLGTGAFDIEFNYDRIQWESGDYYGGTNGFGGMSAIAGFSDGALMAVQLPGSEVNGAFLDTNLITGLIHNSKNSSVNGRYRFGATDFTCVTNGSPLSITANGFTPDGRFQFTVTGATNAGCSVYRYFGFTPDDIGQVIAGVNLASGSATFVDYVVMESGCLYKVKHGVDDAYCASVGFLPVTIGPQSTLVANHFDNPAGNTVNVLFATVPNGTTLRKWNEATQAYVTNTYSSGWSNPSMTLNPGEGAFIDNPTTNSFVVTFFGNPRQGNLTNALPAGQSIRSSLAVESGVPESLQLDANFVGGEKIYKWNTATQSFDVYTKVTGSWEWDPADIFINVGEAFFIETDTATSWDRWWTLCRQENQIR